VCDRRRDKLWIADRRKRDEMGAIGELRGKLRGNGQAQTGFANSRRAAQRQ
jgi:hypothetical protein